MRKISLPILELWYKALHSPVGIIVTSTNRTDLVNKLYFARTETRDLDLAHLSICMSPTSENEIWIVHQQVKVEAPDISTITPEPENG